MKKQIFAAITACAIATAAHAQTTPPARPDTMATPPAAAADKVVLTEAEAKRWVDKRIYSSDGSDIGEVVAFLRDANGVVSEMHADIGGFLGIGETRVRLTPAQFKLQGDRVMTNLTADQAKQLPKVTK